MPIKYKHLFEYKKILNTILVLLYNTNFLIWNSLNPNLVNLEK